MKIAFLLLCHETPRAVAEALSSPFFLSPDVKVYLHYDGRRSAAHLSELQALLQDGPEVAFISERVACRWGEYSLVEATHRLMAAALDDDMFAADRLFLISGSCIPYRPLSSLQAFLDQDPEREYIEAVDVRRARWVQDGLQEERYQYYFPFNFRTQRRWFEFSTNLQRRLKVQRRLPESLRIHFGSQWFCISRKAASHVVNRLNDPVIRQAFLRCWIPDEFVIQTLVAEIASSADLAGHGLTYYEFDLLGRPLVLDNGHFDHLLRQPHFFARKISPTAESLKADISIYVQKKEYDLSYFERIGTPTADYRCHLARTKVVSATRTLVSSTKDEWRGVMDNNDRAYIVLWSSCLPYAHALLGAAHSQFSADDPVFGELFHPAKIDIGAWGDQHLGFSSRHTAWRDYAPASFLYQISHAHPSEPAVFMVDATTPSWLRDFVAWDPNAILINMDPPGLTKVQRAESGLRHAPRYWGQQLVESIYHAAFSNDWLPQEHYWKLQRENALPCRMLCMHEVDLQFPSSAMRKVAAIEKSSIEENYFLSDHLAWLTLRNVRLARQ